MLFLLSTHTVFVLDFDWGVVCWCQVLNKNDILQILIHLAWVMWLEPKPYWILILLLDVYFWTYRCCCFFRMIFCYCLFLDRDVAFRCWPKSILDVLSYNFSMSMITHRIGVLFAIWIEVLITHVISWTYIVVAFSLRFRCRLSMLSFGPNQFFLCRCSTDIFCWYFWCSLRCCLWMLVFEQTSLESVFPS